MDSSQLALSRRSPPMVLHVSYIDNNCFPAAFYDVPSTAVACFSTHRGLLDKKPLLTPRPSIIARSDLPAQVRAKAASLRCHYPDITEQVEPPSAWEDLYKYFDAYDLWTEGTHFLLYVLYDLSNHSAAVQQQAMDRQALDLRKKAIDLWAAQCIARDEDRFLERRSMTDMTALLDEDQLHEIEKLEVHELQWLRRSLRHHHLVLQRKKHVEGQQAALQSKLSTTLDSTTIDNLHLPNAVVTSSQKCLSTRTCESSGCHKLCSPRGLGTRIANEPLRLRDRIDNHEDSAPYGLSIESTRSDRRLSGSRRNRPASLRIARTSRQRNIPSDLNLFPHYQGPSSKTSRPVYVYGSQMSAPPHIYQAPWYGSSFDESLDILGNSNQSGFPDRCTLGNQSIPLTYFDKTSLPFSDHFPNDERARETEKWIQYCYTGPWMTALPNDRILFVGNLDLRTFLSHELGNLIASLVPLNSIRYLKKKNSAFISLGHPSFLPTVIQQFHGYRTRCGRHLSVEYPHSRTACTMPSSGELQYYNGYGDYDSQGATEYFNLWSRPYTTGFGQVINPTHQSRAVPISQQPILPSSLAFDFSGIMHQQGIIHNVALNTGDNHNGPLDIWPDNFQGMERQKGMISSRKKTSVRTHTKTKQRKTRGRATGTSKRRKKTSGRSDRFVGSSTQLQTSEQCSYKFSNSAFDGYSYVPVDQEKRSSAMHYSYPSGILQERHDTKSGDDQVNAGPSRTTNKLLTVHEQAAHSMTMEVPDNPQNMTTNRSERVSSDPRPSSGFLQTSSQNTSMRSTHDAEYFEEALPNDEKTKIEASTVFPPSDMKENPRRKMKKTSKRSSKHKKTDHDCTSFAIIAGHRPQRKEIPGGSSFTDSTLNSEYARESASEAHFDDEPTVEHKTTKEAMPIDNLLEQSCERRKGEAQTKGEERHLLKQTFRKKRRQPHSFAMSDFMLSQQEDASLQSKAMAGNSSRAGAKIASISTNDIRKLLQELSSGFIDRKTSKKSSGEAEFTEGNFFRIYQASKNSGRQKERTKKSSKEHNPGQADNSDQFDQITVQQEGSSHKSKSKKSNDSAGTADLQVAITAASSNGDSSSPKDTKKKLVVIPDQMDLEEWPALVSTRLPSSPIVNAQQLPPTPLVLPRSYCKTNTFPKRQMSLDYLGTKPWPFAKRSKAILERLKAATELLREQQQR